MSATRDTVVQAIVEKFLSRSALGIEKYGTTLDRDDLNTLEWINHAQEELMDAILYLERLKKEYNRPSTPVPPETPPNTPPTASILCSIFSPRHKETDVMLDRPIRKAQRKIMSASEIDVEDINAIGNNGLL